MKRRLRSEERLTALRESDSFRKWYSLDDRRVCVLCDKVISGRMVEVGPAPGGGYRLQCPTPGCAATPRDWFYHGTTRDAAPRIFHSAAPIRSFGA